ncbi:hypothetical protein TDMWS_05110 [Thermodesulfomicrobium sp. WS]|nr:hypothetical protein TDMWS_05110 [Thermodesulfomicrobium sp. WS]
MESPSGNLQPGGTAVTDCFKSDPFKEIIMLLLLALEHINKDK